MCQFTSEPPGSGSLRVALFAVPVALPAPQDPAVIVPLQTWTVKPMFEPAETDAASAVLAIASVGVSALLVKVHSVVPPATTPICTLFPLIVVLLPSVLGVFVQFRFSKLNPAGTVPSPTV